MSFPVNVLLPLTHVGRLLADCGNRGSIIVVRDLDDIDDFDKCSTLRGSLYLYTSSDSEYDNIILSSALESISGVSVVVVRRNDRL